MRYVAPTNSPSPDAHYVGRNPAAGIQGSQVPPAAIEHPMREILEVITHFGLTPDADDLTQLRQAIEAGLRSATGYTLPIAAVDRLGGVKIGANISIASDGTISVAAPGGGGGGGGGYTLPPASITTLGGVKIGAGVIVQTDGTISATPASVGALNKTGDTATGNIAMPNLLLGSAGATGSVLHRADDGNITLAGGQSSALAGTLVLRGRYSGLNPAGFEFYAAGAPVLQANGAGIVSFQNIPQHPTAAAYDSSLQSANTEWVQREVARNFSQRGSIVGAYLCGQSNRGSAVIGSSGLSLQFTFTTPQPDTNYNVIGFAFSSSPGIGESGANSVPQSSFVPASLTNLSATGFGLAIPPLRYLPGDIGQFLSVLAIR